MPRYNTILSTSTVSAASTVATPQAGLFTTLTGTAPYTVTVGSPVVFNGQSQQFYNSTSGTVTLSTPAGSFVGPGASSLATQPLPAGSIVTITSDGSNYVISFEQGGPLTATTGTFTGAIAVNATGGITTSQTSFSLVNATATSVDIAGAATTLTLGNTATGAQTVNMFTASTAASTYNIATGATANATTKAVNIGTGGVSGSTTNVNIGSNGGGTTTLNSSTIATPVTSGTLDLFNTGLTGTLRVGGAASTLQFGSSSSTATFNGNVNVATGKAFQVNGANVLSGTALGSTVTGSSLTSVGTLTGLTVGSGGNFGLNSSGAFTTNPIPDSSGGRTLGTSGTRWGTIFTNDLDLSNGIGDYTIVEGEDDLFLYNNKKGKVYKFAIIEVDPSEAPPKGVTY